jgi:SAM-dependent methyltransferase
MPLTARKASGAHFTPPALAALLAERFVALLPARRTLRVLDPACGDGNLLAAVVNALPGTRRKRVTLVGVEKDTASLVAARDRLLKTSKRPNEWIEGDFLALVGEGHGKRPQWPKVDAIIANPPYVRTQVLGAARSQSLARRFGLVGRVDLSQAFLVAMGEVLKPGGMLALITSNRFLSTRAGQASREYLNREFELLDVVDLGDTRLFEAAVLPALVFARRRKPERRLRGTERSIRLGAAPSMAFTRIYLAESNGMQRDTKVADDASCVTELVRRAEPGLYRVQQATYRVDCGALAVPDDARQPWRLTTHGENDWLRRVEAGAAARVGEVAHVRVGVKTTADAVFIRDDWETLPESLRPEPKHLRRLLRQDEAVRWRMPHGRARSWGVNRILYPHAVKDHRREVVEYAVDSPTRAYLESHRTRLEQRKYVIEAGRKWYEIWVPQDPAGWAQPKLVFPDISPEPRFFLDRGGSIVDGNCYWIVPKKGPDEDLLLLIMGVANSTLMARYHDLAFPNRLYSGRRRHLTQYVCEYPLPDATAPASRRLVETVRGLTARPPSAAARRAGQQRVDRLVEHAFGMSSADDLG